MTRALRVGLTPHAGRGVFAVEPIQAGEVIEECPVVVVPEAQVSSLLLTSLCDYHFWWGPSREDAAIALGHGSLYNHSYEPCAMYVRKPLDLTILFIALRDIAPGEEITVNYNGSPEDRTPVWFDKAPERG